VSPRKQRRRWNRGTVCWYLLGIAAVQIGLGAAVERAGPVLRDPVYQRNAARLAERRAEYPDRPLLVALGSSRTLMGLNAGRVTRADQRWLVYNCSDFGAGPMLEQVFLRRLLTAGVRPEAVLLELVPLQLAAGKLVPMEESSLDTGRLTAPELRSVAGYYSHPVTSGFRWLQARGMPCVSRQRALHDALQIDEPAGSQDGTPDAFGFLGYGRGPTASFEIAAQKVYQEYAPWLPTARMADGPKRAFRGLVETCRRERLPFAVVLMPEADGFRRLYPPSFTAEVDRFLADLRGEADFRLIDARTWVPDAGFADPHHLHAEGAAIFSDRLFRDWLADYSPPSRDGTSLTAGNGIVPRQTCSLSGGVRSTGGSTSILPDK
jgi:hypothetical protein